MKLRLWRVAVLTSACLVAGNVAGGQRAFAQDQTSKDPAKTELSDEDQQQLIQMLIELGKWVLENREEIGKSIAEATNGVTNIKKISNQTGHQVVVWKIDGDKGNQEWKIEPNQTVEGDFWIPWADNTKDGDQLSFQQHHMTLRVGDKLKVFMWQSGKAIRMALSETAAKGNVPGGQSVPGESKAGGDRALLIIEHDGKLGFALGSNKKNEKQ